ncbi:MAG: TonB family protein [Acidimicrobiia bacterium]|nr:TonB family protein [Acidimicrobiia bacterium]
MRQDGTVGDVTVKRSLDATSGLDRSAIDAIRMWTFTPGTRNGRPVPVRVAVNMTFTLTEPPAAPCGPAEARSVGSRAG